MRIEPEDFETLVERAMRVSGLKAMRPVIDRS